MADMSFQQQRPIFDSSRPDLGLIDVLTVLRGLVEEMRRDGREVPQFALEATISMLKRSDLTEWTAAVDGEQREITAFNRALMTLEVSERG